MGLGGEEWENAGGFIDELQETEEGLWCQRIYGHGNGMHTSSLFVRRVRLNSLASFVCGLC